MSRTAAAFVSALHGRDLPEESAEAASGAVAEVFLGDERGWLARFLLDDVPRAEARDVVRALAGDGARIILLSGDHPARAARIAADLGISDARGAATPEGKLAHVRELQQGGAIVAMVGDGVNDAPVLAQAQVSIALSSGTDLAQGTADVVLMGDRLEVLVDARRRARHALRVIRQNLAWAVAYNAVALPLAMAGMVTPLAAAAGMSASSLFVVLNALRLLRQGRA